jgi:hypothetical protein
MLGTVNKYNSKLLAFNRVFKSHYYMFQSTEISTFISSDCFLFCTECYFFLLFLLCSLSVSLNYFPSPSFSISHAGGRTQQPMLVLKVVGIGARQKVSMDKSLTVRQMMFEKQVQTNSGSYIQPH